MLSDISLTKLSGFSSTKCRGIPRVAVVIVLMVVSVGFPAAMLAAAPPATARSAPAADDLTEVLKLPVLKPGEASQQHIDYVAARIPKLQRPATADDWIKQANSMRESIRQNVVFRGMPRNWYEAKPRVEWFEEIATGQGYRIRKLRYEALPGLWIPALLYQPEKLSGKMPVMLNVNGHDPIGKAADYKQLRCINLAKRGIIALNPEWLGMGQLGGASYRHNDLAKLDLTGRAGLGVFFLAMSRGLDVLLALPHADAQRVGVTGLSGGGWQTIILSSLDTRVTLSVPVAGYSSLHQRLVNRSSIGDLEQNPCDLIRHGDYSHLTALMVPRPTLLIYNSKDNCCFASATVKPNTFDPVVPFFEQAKAGDRFEYYENSDPGTHNYELDNRERMYRFVIRHFYSGEEAKRIPLREIASKSELKTREELNVPLPQSNATFGSLAADAANDLPLPTKNRGATTIAQRRQKLREILRWRALAGSLEPVAEAKEKKPEGEQRIERFRLRLRPAKASPRTAPDWTIPLVIVTPKAYKRTVLLVAEDGRQPLAEKISQLAASGARVAILEPVLMGEAKPAGILYMNAHLLATVGDRPLGIQAAQILAAVEVLKQNRVNGGQNSAEVKSTETSIELIGTGPRSSLAALCATAVAGRPVIGSLQTEKLPASLKDYLKPTASFDATPEAYCFGLLQEFDIETLRLLSAEKN